jgi:bifunctional aspartokinase / homoserine dehydrogenase 1
VCFQVHCQKPFSYFLKNAIELGYTEPDPREDLCGNDVARKLLILARELDLENEFDEIEIENLIPENLRQVEAESFLSNIEKIDPHYRAIKEKLKKGKVLRYIGDLSGDLQKTKGNLKVELVAVSENSALGNLKGSDSIFEIYTESYQDNPITIIGAGAGAEVTARGVFGDILRIANKK